MTDLVRLYVSGEVNRWHQNPAMARIGQSIADHAGRCVQLLLILHPRPSPALVRHVALHDVGELDAGDLSLRFKEAEPEIAAVHAAFEAGRRQAICGLDDYLTPLERAWAKLIDRVEAAAYVLLTNPREAERIASGWSNDRAAAIRAAEELGVNDQVARLFAGLSRGEW